MNRPALVIVSAGSGAFAGLAAMLAWLLAGVGHPDDTNCK